MYFIKVAGTHSSNQIVLHELKWKAAISCFIHPYPYSHSHFSEVINQLQLWLPPCLEHPMYAAISLFTYLSI